LNKLLPKILVGSIFLLGGILILQNFSFLPDSSVKAGASDNVHGWAWSDNIGWISFNCEEGGPSQSNICTTSNYGVTIDSLTGEFSGYAWSDNIGWISFNEADLIGCPSGTCKAEVVISGSDVGKLSGWARVTNSTDEDYGWISLSDVANERHQVFIDTNNGHFNNYAWGGGPSDEATIGWINFNCLNESECPSSNYYVWTDLSFNSIPWTENRDTTPPTNEDFCENSASYVLSWTFKDTDTDAYEKNYELEISNLTSGDSEIYYGGPYPAGTIIDGDLQTISLSLKTSEDLTASPPELTYGQTYNWSIRVQDDFDAWSDWETGPQITVPLEYPDCAFTFSPEKPRVDQEINFFDASTQGSYQIISWLWDFGDGGISTDKNPTYTYFEVAAQVVKLTITDSAGRSCSYEQTLNIRPGDPNWNEVIPR